MCAMSEIAGMTDSARGSSIGALMNLRWDLNAQRPTEVQVSRRRVVANVIRVSLLFDRELGGGVDEWS